MPRARGSRPGGGRRTRVGSRRCRLLEFGERSAVRKALVERPVEAGIALLQRKRLVAEKRLVVLLVTME